MRTASRLANSLLLLLLASGVAACGANGPDLASVPPQLTSPCETRDVYDPVACDRVPDLPVPTTARLQDQQTILESGFFQDIWVVPGWSNDKVLDWYETQIPSREDLNSVFRWCLSTEEPNDEGETLTANTWVNEAAGSQVTYSVIDRNPQTVSLIVSKLDLDLGQLCEAGVPTG